MIWVTWVALSWIVFGAAGLLVAAAIGWGMDGLTPPKPPKNEIEMLERWYAEPAADGGATSRSATRNDRTEA